jgi:hypothetical protein
MILLREHGRVVTDRQTEHEGADPHARRPCSHRRQHDEPVEADLSSLIGAGEVVAIPDRVEPQLLHQGPAPLEFGPRMLRKDIDAEAHALQPPKLEACDPRGQSRNAHGFWPHLEARTLG